jgi:hypothetical protein
VKKKQLHAGGQLLGENLGRRRAAGQRSLLATTSARRTRSPLLRQHQKLVFATTTTVHVRGTIGDWDEFYF